MFYLLVDLSTYQNWLAFTKKVSNNKTVKLIFLKNYRVSLPSRFPSFVVRPSPWMPPGFSRCNVLQTKTRMIIYEALNDSF